VLVVFLALPECFRRGEQVTVDVIDHVVPARGVEILKVVAGLASVAFLGLLLYTGVQPLQDAFRFGDRKPDLPIPVFTLLGAIELALLACVLLVASQVVQAVRALLRGDRHDAR
jgi:TRAP-type C4-dicarboxylate transport system permease small subunit